MAGKTSLIGIATLALLAVSCLTGPPQGEEPDQGELYLNLVWHQHQPLYYRDAETGVYTRPWVRVHATKDYADMAAMLEQYPNVTVTFNLTPVLLRQLDDYVDGAKDAYWVLAEKPAAELGTEDRRFLLERFFDANAANVIRRFPGYARLLDLRGSGSAESIERALAAFSEQDLRDLQIWFNLAWFDPDYLAREPLLGLVRKDHGFSEADKTVIFDEVRRVLVEVIPIHRSLLRRGRIDIITTPYAHPILPLVFNSDIVERNDPTAEVPERFSYPQDAIAHLSKSIEVYRSHFGRAPSGLWPGEGAVSQDIVKPVADAGYRWMASGEQVLARSLEVGGFSRDETGTVEEADLLYRPYYVRYRDGPRVAMVFRDMTLSDLIGFEYSGTPAEEAARDFMERLERIGARLRGDGAEGPHLVSVILDGENAWEYYPNDGKEFLHALYRLLSESRTVRTITVSEYLRRFPDQRSIDELWPGCWFSPDYSTWIGEPEETVAWEYLGRARAALARYDLYHRKSTTPERLDAALDAMYLAEGSDWFWWYGSDQDSGVDEYFDRAFRELLGNVYRALGQMVPEYLSVPVMSAAAAEPADAVGLGDMTELLHVTDPRGDDNGPGTYVYPLDAVFTPGVFDVQTLIVSETDSSLVARFGLSVPITNSWGSPIRLSLQTFDLYIDVDPGAGTGATALLEGRNASLAEGFGWEYAVWVEGWNQKVLTPNASGKPVELPGTPVKVVVSEPDGVVTIIVDKRVLAASGSPRDWAYAAAVLGQDGFPSPGVRRVRDVLPSPAQWRFGGAQAGASYTRIVDLVWPEGTVPDQAAVLATGIPMLRIGGAP